MCTNYALIKKNGTTQLAEILGVDANALIYGDNFKAGSHISIVTGDSEHRACRETIWWLYLRQTEQGLKPHSDYFSVNTNHKKLPQKAEYRTSRCIVPVSAFAESQNGKNPHLLEPADGSAMAFGGLYKEWTDRTTGEIVTSASIITLAGHLALADIHRKSVPLWLPEEAYEAWLSPATPITSFDELLKPALRTDLLATPIDRVGTKNPVGEASVVSSRLMND